MRISSKFGWLMLIPVLCWGQETLAFGYKHCELKCDNDEVTRFGKTFTVIPTGSDDTSNIQCAFDSAVTCGRGARVKLSEGTFHTAQIVVKGFAGQFLGAGKNKTVVQNLPLQVTVDDFQNTEPCRVDGCSDDAGEGAGTWPSIFAFIGGDFTVSDMTIRAVGDHPTNEWWGLTAIAHAIVVLGPEARIKFYRGLIEGKVVDGAYFGTNLINGILPEGNFGGYPDELQSGKLEVKHSTFRDLTSAVFLTGVQNYRAKMHHNVFDRVWTSLETCYLVETKIEHAHNWVNADPSPYIDPLFDKGFGVNMYDCGLFGDPNSQPVGLTDSTVVIKNNRFQGDNGPFLDVLFDGEVRCRLVNNDVADVESVGIYLGEGTRDCVVRGSGPDAVIDDLGDNDVRDH